MFIIYLYIVVQGNTYIYIFCLCKRHQSVNMRLMWCYFYIIATSTGSARMFCLFLLFGFIVLCIEKINVCAVSLSLSVCVCGGAPECQRVHNDTKPNKFQRQWRQLQQQQKHMWSEWWGEGAAKVMDDDRLVWWLVYIDNNREQLHLIYIELNCGLNTLV